MMMLLFLIGAKSKDEVFFEKLGKQYVWQITLIE